MVCCVVLYCAVQCFVVLCCVELCCVVWCCDAFVVASWAAVYNVELWCVGLRRIGFKFGFGCTVFYNILL